MIILKASHSRHVFIEHATMLHANMYVCMCVYDLSLYHILSTFIPIYENIISFDTRSVTSCGMTLLISCTQFKFRPISILHEIRMRVFTVTLYCLKFEILVPAPQKKHCISVTKTNRVMLYRVMVS